MTKTDQDPNQPKVKIEAAPEAPKDTQKEASDAPAKGLADTQAKPDPDIDLLQPTENPEANREFSGDLEEGLASTQHLDRENPAGKIHEKYLEGKYLENAETHTDSDRTKLGNTSIEDIRFNHRLLKIRAGDENAETQIKNLKEETTRRINAYTSKRDKNWYTLDYLSVGKQEHEMKIGLGDILVDPDIQDILIHKDGLIIKAHRETVSKGRDYAGRVGFVDENGNYIRTFTGDRFRILTSKEMSSEEYLSKLIQENKDRDSDRKNYVAEKTSYLKYNKVDKLTSELIEETKKQNPNLSFREILLKVIATAEEKLKSETDEELKNSYQKVVDNCKQMAEDLKVSPNFDLFSYKTSIAAIESGSKSYRARNDAGARARGVSSESWAFGKYQFITSTLRGFGVELGRPIQEEKIQAFLNNELLQEKIMNQYTLGNLRSLRPEQIQRFHDHGYSVNQVLAAMHLGGPGAINKSSGTIKAKVDYFGTTSSRYISMMK